MSGSQAILLYLIERMQVPVRKNSLGQRHRCVSVYGVLPSPVKSRVPMQMLTIGKDVVHTVQCLLMMMILGVYVHKPS
jgi:hypothetical protein